MPQKETVQSVFMLPDKQYPIATKRFELVDRQKRGRREPVIHNIHETFCMTPQKFELWPCCFVDSGLLFVVSSA
jgi:hypothetical protein